MKKKFFCMTFFIFLSIICVANEKLKTFVSGAYDVYSKEDGIYFTSPIYDDVFFDKNKLIIDQYEWKKIVSNDLPFGDYDKYKGMYIEFDSPYIISGSNYAIILSSNSEGYKEETMFITSYQETLEGIETFTTEEVLTYQSPTYERKEWGNILAYHNIKEITSSSYYTENTKNGTIEYIPQTLPALFSLGMHCTWIRHSPWVPGKENTPSGIGEYLDIEFDEKEDNLVILNGYVDPFKHYLYKANNRVKTAVIKSLDEKNPFEIEYKFEDYVHFSEINFPCEVNKVRFTIKEVYKGERWDDTCITAVITRWALDSKRVKHTGGGGGYAIDDEGNIRF